MNVKSAEETPQGTADPLASGLGGTPPGGAGLSRDEVARRSPTPRRSGVGSKQPTKRKSVKQKAKRAATAKSNEAGARKAGTRKAAGGTARKAAATRNTARKRASKSGATRRRVHQRH